MKGCNHMRCVNCSEGARTRRVTHDREMTSAKTMSGRLVLDLWHEWTVGRVVRALSHPGPMLWRGP